MKMRPDDLLFNKYSWHGLLEGHKAHAKKYIENLPSLDGELEQLTDEIAERFAVQVAHNFS